MVPSLPVPQDTSRSAVNAAAVRLGQKALTANSPSPQLTTQFCSLVQARLARRSS
jgi:hypothetical protein